MSLLSKEEIINALERLGQLAEAQELSIELLLVGGAAMVLLYDIRPSTRDVDVLILTPEASIVRSLAKKVAQETNLPDDWLNDLVPGDELKAEYAFLDLWEVIYGKN